MQNDKSQKILSITLRRSPKKNHVLASIKRTGSNIYKTELPMGEAIVMISAVVDNNFCGDTEYSNPGQPLPSTGHRYISKETMPNGSVRYKVRLNDRQSGKVIIVGRFRKLEDAISARDNHPSFNPNVYNKVAIE